MIRVVNSAEMRRLEELAVAHGCPVERLMERAAQGIATAVLCARDKVSCAHVVVLAGPGNNGGDALLAGQFLASAGCDVQLWTWNRRRPAPEGVVLPSTSIDSETLPVLTQTLGGATLVLDGLLGTGRNRAIAGTLAELLLTLRRCRPAPPVVAIDVPTGVHADTGVADAVAVRARFTIALGCAKPGLFAQPGGEHAGDVVVVPLGLPVDDTIVSGTVIDEETVGPLTPIRVADANKGTSGKVLVVGGSERYLGAPLLAGTSAVRCGAGLVSLGVSRNVYDLIAATSLACTYQVLDAEAGAIGPAAVDVLIELAQAYDVIVLGPGLGQAAATQGAVQRLLDGALARSETSARFVVDADGLNALAAREHWWNHLPSWAILTPHPGEMARLAGSTTKEVQEDRVAVARTSAIMWGHVVVLKGSGTIVAAPDGRWSISPAAVPALATAGTGDVLAGAIGALLAQRLPPYDAARLGVYIHARAGEMLSLDGHRLGLSVEELPAQLSRVLSRLSATYRSD